MPDPAPSRRTLLRAGITAATASSLPSASRASPADGAPIAAARAGGEVSLLELAPRSEWDAIAAGRSTLSLSRAMAAAGAAGLCVTVPPGTFHLGEDCVLRTPVRFVGGRLRVATGVTVTFEGAILAPPAAIFANATGGLGTVRPNPATTPAGFAEWWGARANDAGFDSQPAIQAAVDALPIIQLCGGDYRIGRTVAITRNGTVLRGVAATQADEGPAPRCTRLIVTDPAAAGVRIGADSPGQPSPLVEYVRLEDLTVSRGGAIERPAPDRPSASIGVALRWCVNCHVSRVETLDHAIGFSFYGTIENYVRNCSAVRLRAEPHRPGGTFIGFYLDYSAPLAANGGNASLYLDRCRAFGPDSGELAYAAGMASRDGFVDLYISAFECGHVHYGIDLNGRRYDGGRDFRTEDLLISQCVLDSCASAGIRLRTGDTSTAVSISGSYISPLRDGVAIELADLGGSVSLTGNQYVSDIVGGGLRATAVNGLSSVNNIYSAPPRPIRLERVTNFRLQDTIHLLGGGNPSPAIGLVDCQGGKVDCIVNGPTGCCSSGVAISGAGTSGIEVACTLIQGTAPAAGAANTLVCDGARVVSPGPFGRNCLAQGLMT